MGPPRTATSPLASTLSFAASFALPLSRAASPARRDGEAGQVDAASGGAYAGFGGGSSGGRHAAKSKARKEERQGSASAWDEAWDSSSDTEPASASASASASAAREKKSSSHAGSQRGGLNGSASAAPGSSTSGTSSTPIPFTRRAHGRPSLLNRSSSGLGVSPDAPLGAPGTSVSSGEHGGRAFSFQEISPPSPSSYREREDGTGSGGGLARAMAHIRGVAAQRQTGEREGDPSAPERIAGFTATDNGGEEPSPSVPPPQDRAPLLPSAPGAILVATSDGLDPAVSAEGAPAPSATGGSGGGETWTLVNGDEVEAAERAFKGMQIAAGSEASASGPAAAGRTGEGPSKGKGKAGKEALKPEIMQVLADPLYLIRGMSSSNSAASTPNTPDAGPPVFPASSSSSSMKRSTSQRSERRRERFIKVLEGRQAQIGANGLGAGRYGVPVTSTPSRSTGGVDAAELRKLAWSGAPNELRPVAWQMLLNYLPLPAQPRLTTLSRKRREYAQLVEQTFGRGLSGIEANIWHQIEIDVPRTRPGVPLWSCEVTQRSLERILYVWAIRHPASGYVQGINDLVTPFFEVFLSAYVDCDPELFDSSCLPEEVLSAIEADSFWCLSKLLDGIQDNYTAHQPGIHRLVRRMSELVRRIDAPLTAHLEEQGVEFMQFAFRWMNCLLMREISVKCTIRMWDTYLSEGTDAFSQFHLYVCSAFLVKWSDRLREMDFQEIIMFLQCLPTQNWTDHDVELLLSEAFVLKSVWQGAENHFAGLLSTPLGGGMGGR